MTDETKPAPSEDHPLIEQMARNAPPDVNLSDMLTYQTALSGPQERSWALKAFDDQLGDSSVSLRRRSQLLKWRRIIADADDQLKSAGR